MHSFGEKIRLIKSYASDFTHRVFVPKHFLLALALHCITGQEKPVEIANR